MVPGENATFESSWDGTTHTEGTVVFFTCLSGLQTPGGDSVQNQTCTANGWVRDGGRGNDRYVDGSQAMSV